MAGVVPTAGRSSRLGLPKPLLDANGASFVSRVVEALREGGCDSVVVVSRGDAVAVHREALRTGATVLPSDDPDEGPIASIRTALSFLLQPTRASLPEAILLHPVDYPLVRATTVRKLLNAFRKSSVPLVIPYFQDRSGHPILFGRTLFSELLTPSLPEGARTVSRRHRHQALRIDVEDSGILADIDTVEDYRNWFGADPSQVRTPSP